MHCRISGLKKWNANWSRKKRWYLTWACRSTTQDPPNRLDKSSSSHQQSLAMRQTRQKWFAISFIFQSNFVCSFTNRWLRFKRMEKELVTLKVRLEHKEQTLKRSQQFLDEVRLEQLRMIEEHSQEILNLQDTILDQQRAMHRLLKTLIFSIKVILFSLIYCFFFT